MKQYESWGRYAALSDYAHQVRTLAWRSANLPLNGSPQPALPFGLGRSYGDSCLNDGGILLDTTGLNRFIAFDRHSGLLRCEAGMTLAEILKIIVLQGWFLPVTPGTKFVTLGGAIAKPPKQHRDGSYSFYFSDPDGNIVQALYEPTISQRP